MTLTIIVAAGFGLAVGCLVGRRHRKPWACRLSGLSAGVLLASIGLMIENERALAAPRCYWCGAALNPAVSKPFVCPQCGANDPAWRGQDGEFKRAAENAAKTTDLYRELLEAGVPSRDAIKEAAHRVRFGK